MRSITCILLFLFFILFYQDAVSQRRKNNLRISSYRGSIKSFSNKRYVGIGGGINVSNYFGDLSPKSGIVSTDLSMTRPGLSFFVEYKYAPRVTWITTLTYASLSGDDFESADPADEIAKYRYIRNLQFRNNILELSLVGKIDLFTNRGTYLSRPNTNPYAFIGLGVFYHNPLAKAPEFDQLGNPIEEAGTWVALRPLGTEGQYSDSYNVNSYSRIQISLPAGLGISFRLNDKLDFGFEAGYRILFFDHIDDVSGKYVDLGALDNPLTKALSDRSQELNAIVSDEPRDFENVIIPNTSPYTYTSQYDGNTYDVYRGFGSEHPSNIRGNSADNDIFIVTNFKLTYILGGTFRNAKFR
ncbi:MAG: outer membrane beta-barrel protein [Cyclobacteriaceae bacterium]|nr:outer membrane beta-barrel protein [Cyclobacteriaceae bacterium]